MLSRPFASAALVRAAAAPVLLVSACAAGAGAGSGPAAERPPKLGRLVVDDQPTVAAGPVRGSTAPACGHPDDVIGVCQISADGVTVQARELPPGAAASITLDGDYASPPMGCRPRWVREAIVDPGGVVTARFDIPITDRCRLLASMVVRVFVDPGDHELGPVRFGTIPPPAPR